MKKFIYSTMLSMAILAVSVYSNGLSLNSVGTRAGGMGGAFLGIADDYSAVYWNPAGVSYIDAPQIAVSYTGLMPSATYKYSLGTQSIVDAQSEAELFSIPCIAGYVPLISGTLNAGIGFYVPAGIGVTWNGDDLMKISNNTSYKWHSRIGVMTLAPTISLKVLNILSIGAAINLSYGTFELDRPMSQRNPLNLNQYLWGQYSETSSGFGFSGTIGALVKLSSDLSFGATYRTANSIAFEGTASHGILIGLLQANYKDADISREVTWPTWMGAGIAFKPVPGLTLALDAQYSQWSIMDSVETTYKNWEMVGLTKNFMVLKWEDAIQIRFGAEYELLKTVAVRAGFYLDPAPAPDATLNILFPSISYKALTCGASLKLPFIEVEAGLEYLMGTERDNTSSYNAVEGGMPGLHNNNILAFSIGLVLNL